MRHLTINLHLGDQGREEHQQIMADIAELRAEIAANQFATAQQLTDVAELAVRIEAKVNELGQPDPDLTADVAALRESTERARQSSAQIDALLAQAPPPDTGGGTDPGPAPDPTTPDGGGTVTP